MAELEQIYQKVVPKVRGNLGFDTAGRSMVGSSGSGGYGGGSSPRIDVREAVQDTLNQFAEWDDIKDTDKASTLKEGKSQEVLEAEYNAAKLKYTEDTSIYNRTLNGYMEQRAAGGTYDRKEFDAFIASKPVEPQRPEAMDAISYTTYRKKAEAFIEARSASLNAAEAKEFKIQMMGQVRANEDQWIEEARLYKNRDLLDRADSLISGYNDSMDHDASIELINQMRDDGLYPSDDEYTKAKDTVYLDQDQRIMKNMMDAVDGPMAGMDPDQKAQWMKDNYQDIKDAIHQGGEHQGIKTKEGWDAQVDLLYADKEEEDRKRNNELLQNSKDAYNEYDDKSWKAVNTGDVDAMTAMRNEVYALQGDGRHDAAALDALIRRLDLGINPPPDSMSDGDRAMHRAELQRITTQLIKDDAQDQNVTDAIVIYAKRFNVPSAVYSPFMNFFNTTKEAKDTRDAIFAGVEQFKDNPELQSLAFTAGMEMFSSGALGNDGPEKVKQWLDSMKVKAVRDAVIHAGANKMTKEEIYKHPETALQGWWGMSATERRHAASSQFQTIKQSPLTEGSDAMVLDGEVSAMLPENYKNYLTGTDVDRMVTGMNTDGKAMAFVSAISGDIEPIYTADSIIIPVKGVVSSYYEGEQKLTPYSPGDQIWLRVRKDGSAAYGRGIQRGTDKTWEFDEDMQTLSGLGAANFGGKIYDQYNMDNVRPDVMNDITAHTLLPNNDEYAIRKRLEDAGGRDIEGGMLKDRPKSPEVVEHESLSSVKNAATIISMNKSYENMSEDDIEKIDDGVAIATAEKDSLSNDKLNIINKKKRISEITSSGNASRSSIEEMLRLQTEIKDDNEAYEIKLNTFNESSGKLLEEHQRMLDEYEKTLPLNYRRAIKD